MSKKLKDESKEKWLKFVTNDFMSSEESEGDDTYVVRFLPWRAPSVSQMFERLIITVKEISLFKLVDR